MVMQRVVVTAYGHGAIIDRIAVSMFYASDGQEEANARTYCETVNAQNLRGDSWVCARIVPENTPLSVNLFLPYRFSEMVLEMDDRSLQRVFREIDSRTLAFALEDCGAAVLEKALRNISARTAQDLKDEIKNAPSISGVFVTDSQEKIVSVVRHLEETGQIIITRMQEA